MEPIKIGIVGIGNCASSLLQGIEYYRYRSKEESIGLLYWEINGYTPSDIIVSSAFDIDRRKIGKDVHEAIFQPPNCTVKFAEKIPPSRVKVSMGAVLDGCADHMKNFDEEYTFVPADQPEPDKKEIIKILKDSGTEILLNYLPVGSEKATRFYSECALEAGVALINNIPVFIAGDPEWAEKFQRAKIPIIGDDVKSQMGATIIHRSLANLFAKRGVKIDNTYQLNTGGNTDFLNMKDQNRLSSKKLSKTEAVKSVMKEKPDDRNIHIGPSDYVPWLNDKKVAFIRMEGRIFGNVPMDLELRLSVEDSPNSAGAVIDCIRLCKLALDRNIGGVLEGPSALYCKRPPAQYTDDTAFSMIEKFISKDLYN
ncbi:MAG: inositol-3-phosphate synthase [Desulfobacterales bacterium]|nr:inositol-3-phosphate synthase [Desulfobacteraceae bacterium]MBT7085077.1 inositol-3-phosphate synthase [Desulfobacterales bacterium]MBT7696209.1 inositol-3-phosphate synthase [Desulfobacterales bacterium]